MIERKSDWEILTKEINYLKAKLIGFSNHCQSLEGSNKALQDHIRDLELKLSKPSVIYDAGNGQWTTDLENIVPGYKPLQKGLLIQVEDC